MSQSIDRRAFVVGSSGVVLGAVSAAAAQAQTPPSEGKKMTEPTPSAPAEAPFERDYPAPEFRPAWKKPQINRLLVQDFVIYAHSDLAMVQKLLKREPMLVNSFMDWGGGDWESALGGASHMGRRDIVEFLLSQGARIDLFCAAMMGQLEAVKAFLTLQPALIDARGPHGFNLHFHAQVGGEAAQGVLDYLQSVKKLELKPNPFLKKPADKKPAPPKEEPKKPE